VLAIFLINNVEWKYYRLIFSIVTAVYMIVIGCFKGIYTDSLFG